MKILIVIPLLFLSIIWPFSVLAASSEQATENATFAVHWYDVGKAALEGRPGVKSVESGWHKFREVNRVVYDPKKTTLQQMERWLKDTGTYIDTVIDK